MDYDVGNFSYEDEWNSSQVFNNTDTNFSRNSCKAIMTLT